MQIHYAARRADCKQVLHQLERGVPVDARFEVPEIDARYDHRSGEEGSTPLMWAAASCGAGLEMLELLIENGADVNAQSHSLDCTPLNYAVQAADVLKVKLLLSQGANAGFVNKSNYGVLTCAPRSPSLIKLLVSHGADINIKSNYGESIVSISSHRADWNILKLAMELAPTRLLWAGHL